MDGNAKALFAYVTAALQGTTCSVPIPDPERFFRLTREQGLGGWALLGMGSDVDPVLRARLQKDHFHHIAVDQQQRDVADSLAKALDEAKIPFLFLKGTVIKGWLPDPSLRPMGDIDVLIKSGEGGKIPAVMNSAGFTLKSHGDSHDQWEKNRIIVEVHPDIDAHFDPLHRDSLNGLWERAVPDAEGRLQMREDDLLIFLLAHLAKHFHSSGIGFRQILDIGLWEDHVRNQEMKSDWAARLELAGLFRLFQTLCWLNQVWFGILPLFGGEWPEKFEAGFLEQLTDYVLSSGVHGRKEGFNATLPRLVSEERQSGDESSVKRKVFLRTVFPKWATLRYAYPYLEKRPWLLPWAWFSRWLRLLFREGKRSRAKMNEWKVSSEIIREQARFFEKIGL